MNLEFRKFLSILMCIAMIFTNVNISVFAENINIKQDKSDINIVDNAKDFANSIINNVNIDENTHTNDVNLNNDLDNDTDNDTDNDDNSYISKADDIEKEFDSTDIVDDIDFATISEVEKDLNENNDLDIEVDIEKKQNITTSSVVENDLAYSNDIYFDIDDKKQNIATYSDIYIDDSLELATKSTVKISIDYDEINPIENNDNNVFGSILDIPDNKKADMSGNWWFDFGLNGLPKDTIKKIEISSGIRINNRDWDIIETVDDGAGGKNYKLLSKTNIGSSTWSWSGFNCNSFYPYPSHNDGGEFEGSEIFKKLKTDFYPTFSTYEKNNMVLMHDQDHLWTAGTYNPGLKEFDAYVKIPNPDEIDDLNYDKLKNGSDWWVLEHIHRNDGVLNNEGAAVFPADGNYDSTHGADSYTNYKVYRASAGIRPVITMKKDGLKPDPSVKPNVISKDITNADGDLMGFVYIYNESYGQRLHINTIYDDVLKVTDAFDIFSGFTNLTEIIGLDLIDFSQCTNMSYMFEGDSNLTTFTFATRSELQPSFGINATNLNAMFKGCEKLDNLDFLPANFATNVNTMISTFENTKLSAWPTNINTSNVTSMKRLFANNKSTTFNFADATANAVFASCTDVREMFIDSANLTTISVDTNYISLPANIATASDMFRGCTSLIGGGGFSYKEQFVDGRYARVDYGGILPGYFTSTDNSIYDNVEITIDNTWKSNISASGALSNVRKIILTHDTLPSGSANIYDIPLKYNGTSILGTAYLMNSDGRLFIQFVPQIQKLKTTSNWYGFFSDFENVTNIEGLELIDTQIVTTLEETFRNCKKLVTIRFDQNSFQNVTTIQSMFEGCESFRSFTGDIAVFTNLENAQYAFKGCTDILSINIDPFISAGLLYTKEMFKDCGSLTTIYTDNKIINFPAAIDTYNSEKMFENCTSLVGGQGYRYNAEYVNINMANVDFGGIKPGYFTMTDTSKYTGTVFTIPNTWYENATVFRPKSDVKLIKFFDDASGVGDYTVRYDMSGSTDNLKFYILLDTDNKYIVKIHLGNNIDKPKFAANMSGFFKDFTNLTTIEGFDKVDMSEVTNVSELFSGCEKLTNYGSISFNTAAITNCKSMFENCSELTNIDLSKINTSNVSSDGFVSMFSGCKKVKNIVLGENFVLGASTNLTKMFADCEELKTLDLTKFSSNNITDVSEMFKNDKKLTTIIASNNFNIKNITGTDIFLNCDLLEGEQGTKYSSAQVKDSSYACVDEATTAPGYFTWDGKVIISFVGGEGSTGSMDSLVVKKDEATPLPSNGFSKAGYSFTHWEDASGNIYINTITTSESAILTAQWQQIMPSPVPAQNTRGGGGGGSGSSGGGPFKDMLKIETITVDGVFTLKGNLFGANSNWIFDANNNKWKIKYVDQFNQETMAINGFYMLNTVVKKVMGNSSVDEVVSNIYYFDTNGYMYVGLLDTKGDNKRYLFDYTLNSNEGQMVKGWRLINGDWYYFGIDGAMLVNTITPDGYLVGADGKWIKQ